MGDRKRLRFCLRFFRKMSVPTVVLLATRAFATGNCGDMRLRFWCSQGNPGLPIKVANLNRHAAQKATHSDASRRRRFWLNLTTVISLISLLWGDFLACFLCQEFLVFLCFLLLS